MQRYCRAMRSVAGTIRSRISASRVRQLVVAGAVLAVVIGMPTATRADYGFIAIDNFVAFRNGDGTCTVEGQVDSTIDPNGIVVLLGGLASGASVTTDENGFFSYTFPLSPRRQGLVTAAVLELDGIDLYVVGAFVF
jgi:hypothetical protein